MTCSCRPGKLGDYTARLREALPTLPSDRPLLREESNALHAVVLEIFLEDGLCSYHAGRSAASVMATVAHKCGQTLETGREPVYDETGSN
jgi:hypothetical protein